MLLLCLCVDGQPYGPYLIVFFSFDLVIVSQVSLKCCLGLLEVLAVFASILIVTIFIK